MKVLFNCVDDVCYRVDFPNFENINDFLDVVIKGEPRWVLDDTNGIAIQVDKIISICEVRDE